MCWIERDLIFASANVSHDNGKLGAFENVIRGDLIWIDSLGLPNCDQATDKRVCPKVWVACFKEPSFRETTPDTTLGDPLNTLRRDEVVNPDVGLIRFVTGK